MKKTIKHTLPAFLTSLSSLMYTFIIRLSKIELEGPFATEPTPQATGYNVLFFIVLVGLGSLLLYIFLKKMMMSILQIIIFLSLSLTIFSITIFYVMALTIVLGIIVGDEIIFLTGILTTIFSLFIVYRNTHPYASAVLLLAGSGIGSIFGAILPWPSIVAVLLALSIFDIYSVFKGPLKHFIDHAVSGNSEAGSGKRVILRGVTIEFAGLYLGLGDIIFYSMLTSGAFLNPSPSLERTVLTIAGIVAGTYLTLKFLEKRRALPALPLPVILGLALYFTGIEMGL